MTRARLSTFCLLFFSLRLSILVCSDYLLFFSSPPPFISPSPSLIPASTTTAARAAMYTVRWERTARNATTVEPRTYQKTAWWRATGGVVLASASASNGDTRADCGTRRCWRSGRLPLHSILLYQRSELRLHHRVSCSKILQYVAFV